LSDYLTIRNWDKWQTYRKDRQQPPWIKLHRALMRDPNWIALSDAQRGQLIAIWMLAADRDGQIPNNPILIKKICFMCSEPDLNLLIAHGFLDNHKRQKRQPRTPGVTTKNEESDAPEEKRIEAEAEKKIDCADAPTKRRSQIPPDWSPTENQIAALNASLGFQREEVLREIPAFIDNHRGKGNTFADIPAAFRTWMRNSRKYGARGSPGNQTRTQAAIINLRERAKHGNGFGRPGIRDGSGELPPLQLPATSPGSGDLREPTDRALHGPTEITIAANGKPD
jgi:hypothetical protein